MGPFRQILNLLIVWFLTGFWHGASYNFILWGLFYGVLLIIEKLALKKWLDKSPAFLQHIYTMFFVIMGWVLFYFTDMSQLTQFVTDMFSFTGTVIGESALSTTLSFIPLIVVACVASTPLALNMYRKIKNKTVRIIIDTAFCLGVVLLCTASLVNQSYNPFLYFRF